MNKVFLLGGHDLEMITIKLLVENAGEICFDKNLSWDNAFLKEYEQELRRFSDNPYEIYGVELNEDGIIAPSNYTAIDHHNERQNESSSLEQVCNILGKDLDRKLELIAANDKAYIPGMKAINASEEEIMTIREEDRRMQGITNEEENAAKNITKNFDCGLCIVNFEYNHFSPVIDRIYEPDGRYIVYSKSEFTYYGKFRDEILHALSNNEKFKEISFYFGGGENGFFGARLNDVRTIETIINSIKK